LHHQQNNDPYALLATSSWGQHNSQRCTKVVGWQTPRSHLLLSAHKYRKPLLLLVVVVVVVLLRQIWVHRLCRKYSKTHTSFIAACFCICASLPQVAQLLATLCLVTHQHKRAVPAIFLLLPCEILPITVCDAHPILWASVTGSWGGADLQTRWGFSSVGRAACHADADLGRVLQVTVVNTL
jgi:hypothetical protein